MVRIALPPFAPSFAITAALPILLLSACAPVEADDNFISDAPAARVLGEAKNCLPAGSIRSSTVHDDRTIDFRVGSKLYRNTMPRGCHGLGFQESISYDLRGSQLCRPQIIYVLNNIGGRPQRGVGCQLGQFVPIELVKDREGS